ncbi:hypothetical protein ACOZE3_33200 [Streptomyces cinereoruber]|uniref:hypothetical protein n=1 Tax=Streptomyces cinereoruber TaxID=67260 RepID=UPI003BF4CE57
MIHRNTQDDEEPSEEYVFYDEEGEPYTADPYFHETETDADDAYEPLVDDAEPDVFLDVPLLKVDEIDLDVENLRAHVSLQAEVLDLLKLNVGADVVLGRVHLGISGVEAQAQLRVRLDNVARIINRVLTTLDRNPEMLYELARGGGFSGAGRRQRGPLRGGRGRQGSRHSHPRRGLGSRHCCPRRRPRSQRCCP